jgi:N-acetyl-anhydromuramoyl-L-alanine amidase
MQAERGGAWREGWLEGARHCPSPNFSARPAATAVNLVVIHSISLPPGRYGGNAIEQLFTNCLDSSAHPYFDQLRDLKVSAHFVVGRNGPAVQYVSCDERAWHAGVSQWRGRAGCNDFSIGIELEGVEDESFDPRQYETLAALLVRIAQRYPIDGVAGHEHVAPGRKRDPGRGFDWSALIDTLGWPARYFPDVVTRRI